MPPYRSAFRSSHLREAASQGVLASAEPEKSAGRFRALPTRGSRTMRGTSSSAMVPWAATSRPSTSTFGQGVPARDRFSISIGPGVSRLVSTRTRSSMSSDPISKTSLRRRAHASRRSQGEWERRPPVSTDPTTSRNQRVASPEPLDRFVSTGPGPVRETDKPAMSGREASGPRGNRTPVCDVRGRRPNR